MSGPDQKPLRACLACSLERRNHALDAHCRRTMVVHQTSKRENTESPSAETQSVREVSLTIDNQRYRHPEAKNLPPPGLPAGGILTEKDRRAMVRTGKPPLAPAHEP